MSRLRQAGAFLAGFLVGALTLYAWHLGKGRLGPVSTPAPPVTLASSPLPPAAPSAPSAGPALPISAPSASFATPAPWAPQAEAPLAVPDVPAPPHALPAPPLDLGDLARLKARDLAFPVQGVDARRIHDNFTEMRGAHVHEAIDILAPRGTPVVAVDDGIVQKLFTSVPGGLTIYEFDRDRAYCYYYAHLDRYADGLKEGMTLKKGDVIGYVGTSGNAPPGTPHLHFTIFKLGPEKQWWKGTAVNPFPLWALKAGQAGSSSPLPLRGDWRG